MNPGPDTPEGFWDVGFPETQELEVMWKRQREEVEAEDDED